MSQSSSPYKKAAWRRFRKNPLALTGLVIIIISMLLAISAYWVSPDGSPNANRQIVEIGGQKPGKRFSFLLLKKERPITKNGFFKRLMSGQEDQFHHIPITAHQFAGDSIIIEAYRDEGLTETLSYPKTALAPTPVITQTFWLGTDKFGRDILSRIILGTRISLSVGLITVIISLSIGLLLGSLAGYFKGRTDSIIMWLINVIWSIPTLLLVFAITLALGRGFWQVFVAVGFTMWVNVARLVRGQVMAMRKLEFVEAAKALGYSHMRTIVKHIWPNIMGPVIVIAASNFASAIVIEAGLSFLGIGVQPPQPSWGLMIKENYNYIITQNPVLALAPGVAIMLLVLAFNLLGNGLRDALNVR